MAKKALVERSTGHLKNRSQNEKMRNSDKTRIQRESRVRVRQWAVKNRRVSTELAWKRLDFRKQNMLKVRIGGLKGPVSRISNGKNSNILYF